MSKILIIEDEEVLLTALVDKFTKEGFEVKGVRDGQDGLNFALKIHPDIILLDIIMPIMDGMTMLGELRKDPWGKEAEVILLTNLSDSRKVAESLDKGVFEYLIKSDWKIEDIVNKVKEKIAPKHS